MATLYKATGEQTEVKPKRGHDFTLEELQGYVGGFIEMVGLTNGLCMILDEEGKIKRKPVNRAGTLLFNQRVADVLHATPGAGKSAVAEHNPDADFSVPIRDYIVGDVLVGTREEFGG